MVKRLFAGTVCFYFDFFLTEPRKQVFLDRLRLEKYKYVPKNIKELGMLQNIQNNLQHWQKTIEFWKCFKIFCIICKVHREEQGTPIAKLTNDPLARNIALTR